MICPLSNTRVHRLVSENGRFWSPELLATAGCDLHFHRFIEKYVRMYGHTNVSSFHFKEALIVHLRGCVCVCGQKHSGAQSEHESLKTAPLSQNGGRRKLSALLYLRNLALILARRSNTSFSDSTTTDGHEQMRDRWIVEETPHTRGT